MSTPQHYARHIAAARTYAGLSRDQLAAHLEVHVSTIGRWERGEGAPPRRPDRQALARACDVPEWFIEHGFTAQDEAPAPDPPAGLLDQRDPPTPASAPRAAAN